jgi:hypothetical protein
MKICFPKEKGSSKIIVTCGYDCGDASHCDKSKHCKHRAKYRYHNFMVKLNRFFEYKLHIKFPHLICFQKEWVRLSGTKLCPYHKSRNYTCWDCKYNTYTENCLNETRNNTPYKETLCDSEWGKKCKFFDKNEWADDYKNNLTK